MKITYRWMTLAVASGVGALLVLALMHQQSEITRLRNANAKLEAENGSLTVDASIESTGKALVRKSVSPHVSEQAMQRTLSPRRTLAGSASESSTTAAQMSENIPKTKGPKPWHGEVLTVNKPASEPGIGVSDASARPVADGVVATIKFNSASNAPLEEFALVVRLPKTSDARILNLEPTDPSYFTDASTQVQPNGKFAIFKGTSKTTGSTSFNLALSAPETADVRGTSGMKPFLLKIDSSSATIQDYPTR
jgi:hypothetical protein